jgi:hypothetical protein
MKAGEMQAILDAGGTLHIEAFAVGLSGHLKPHADGEGYLPTWVLRSVLAAHYGNEDVGEVVGIVAKQPNRDECAEALRSVAALGGRGITRDVKRPLVALLEALNRLVSA